MAINTTAVTNALNYAVTNPALARTHGWVNKRSGQTLTTTEDLPELRRQLLAIRHVRPVSFARGWAG
jgi:hypothetical protein